MSFKPKKQKRLFTYQRRTDSSSSDHCCVPQCSSSQLYNSRLSFHCFPTNEEERARWLAKIRRDALVVTKGTKVCSRHFEAGAFSVTPTGVRRLNKGAVPTLFTWNDYSRPAPRRGVWERRERPAVIASSDPEDEEMDVSLQDHDYCVAPDPAALDVALAQNESMKREIDRLQKQLETVQLQLKFNLRRFAGSDEDIRFYTR